MSIELFSTLLTNTLKKIPTITVGIEKNTVNEVLFMLGDSTPNYYNTYMNKSLVI